MKVTAFALFLPKFNEADIIILNLFVIINITNGKDFYKIWTVDWLSMVK